MITDAETDFLMAVGEEGRSGRWRDYFLIERGHIIVRVSFVFSAFSDFLHYLSCGLQAEASASVKRSRKFTQLLTFHLTIRSNDRLTIETLDIRRW